MGVQALAAKFDNLAKQQASAAASATIKKPLPIKNISKELDDIAALSIGKKFDFDPMSRVREQQMIDLLQRQGKQADLADIQKAAREFAIERDVKGIKTINLDSENFLSLLKRKDPTAIKALALDVSKGANGIPSNKFADFYKKNKKLFDDIFEEDERFGMLQEAVRKDMNLSTLVRDGQVDMNAANKFLAAHSANDEILGVAFEQLQKQLRGKVPAEQIASLRRSAYAFHLMDTDAAFRKIKDWARMKKPIQTNFGANYRRAYGNRAMLDLQIQALPGTNFVAKARRVLTAGTFMAFEPFKQFGNFSIERLETPPGDEEGEWELVMLTDEEIRANLDQLLSDLDSGKITPTQALQTLNEVLDAVEQLELPVTDEFKQQIQDINDEIAKQVDPIIEKSAAYDVEVVPANAVDEESSGWFSTTTIIIIIVILFLLGIGGYMMLASPYYTPFHSH